MTIYSFDLDDITARPGPRYRAIADSLRDAIAGGHAEPGAQLPPMRRLAYALGVTVGTVTRAYALAANRGEVTGEVGRGTFIAGAETQSRGNRGVGSAAFVTLREGTEIAMKAAFAPTVGQTDIVSRALAATMAEPRPAEEPFNVYLAPGGSPRHRAAAAQWLAHGDFAPEADDIVVCSGASQGILTAILATTAPGDVILAEEMTYQAITQQAALMGRRIVGVEIDAEGIVPEALARAAKEHAPAALFIVPNLQNPTSAVMGEARRREIAEIARAHEIAIIEDDVYGALLPERPLPIACFAPEISFFGTSLAKTLGSGLRIGFLVPPRQMLDRARAIQFGFGQTVPPLMADLAATLIESGEARTLCGAMRAEVAERHRLTKDALAGYTLRQHDASLYVWVELPEIWRAHHFVEAARAKGLAIAAGDDFMVGRTDRTSRHIRLAIGQPASRDQLSKGLAILRELLETGPLSTPLVA